VQIEAAAVPEYLTTIRAKSLDPSRCEITNSILQTDIERLSGLANSPRKGCWPDDPVPNPYSFVRNVNWTISPIPVLQASSTKAHLTGHSLPDLVWWHGESFGSRHDSSCTMKHGRFQTSVRPL
jgi:hypothetical protein